MEEKGKILVVDDDPQAVMLMEFTLRKAFDVTKAHSGEEALELLEQGFDPGVIFADLMMPGIYGTELLKRALKIVPDATRILVTAHDSPSEIVKAINEAHAFMYIKKPYTNLEIFQAAVVAYDKFKTIRKLKELSKKNTYLLDDDLQRQLKSKNEQIKVLQDDLVKITNELNEKKETLISIQKDNDRLKEEINEVRQEVIANNSFDHEAALALSSYIREFEKFWFTEHTYNVGVIVKALCDKLGLDEKTKQLTIISALLHNVAIPVMPDHLKAMNPNELSTELKENYFVHFTKVINLLRKIKKLYKPIEIISQIWEHIDGTGYPKNLPGSKILLPARIIAVSNLYHTLIYGVTEEQFDILVTKGIVVQSKAEHANRQKEAIKYLFKRISWFDKDILSALNELIQEKASPALKLSNDNLTLDLREFYVSGKNLNLFGTRSDMDKELSLNMNEILEEKNSETLELSPDEVKPGMKVIYNVNTVSNITIIKANKVLDESDVRKIKSFYHQGTLKDTIYVMVEKSV